MLLGTRRPSPEVIIAAEKSAFMYARCMRRGVGFGVLALAVGCQGLIGGTPPDPEPQEEEVCTSIASPGAPVPMRRLTAVQVQRTVSDVLGVDLELAVVDETLFTFRSNVSSSVDLVAARGYLDFAEAATAAVDLSPCSAAGSACDSWLYDDVGARLFRRPLSSDERGRLASLFTEGSSEGSEDGARWVLQAMLQSPTFLYLDEVAREDGYLDDYSMAARLSFTLWGTAPDLELLTAAENGELATAEQLEAQAARMLDDARSIGGMTDFVDQWMRLDRLDDPDARPDLEALGQETLTEMRTEPVQLFQMLVAEGANLQTLLTTNESVTLDNLAPLYGNDIVSDEASTRTFDPAMRSGILSLAGVMAALSHAEATSPSVRGYSVLANLLCKPPPPPPAGVAVTLPDIGPDKTTRERLEAHFSDPTCASCHAAMDGIGFTFESIDWLGRSRSEEFGKPIDDSATFVLDGEEVTVDGVAEMAAALGSSADIANCVARQWASYGAGIPDKDETACLVEHLASEAQGEGGLRAMILAFVASDWYRLGPGLEGTP